MEINFDIIIVALPPKYSLTKQLYEGSPTQFSSHVAWHEAINISLELAYTVLYNIIKVDKVADNYEQRMDPSLSH